MANKGNKSREMFISTAEVELDGETQLVVNLDRRPLRINNQEIPGSNFFITKRNNVPGKKEIQHGMIVIQESVSVSPDLKKELEKLKEEGAIFISSDDRTRIVLKNICNPYRPFLAAGQMFLAELA